MSAPHIADARLQRVVDLYTHLRSEQLTNQLSVVYDVQASFQDPFSHVHGLVAIEHIFKDMFESLESPRFEVLDAFSNGDQAFLTWIMRFEKKGLPKNMSIQGGTHLYFNSAGDVIVHRGYWDSGQELFAKLPVLGRVIRWVAKKMEIQP